MAGSIVQSKFVTASGAGAASAAFPVALTGGNYIAVVGFNQSIASHALTISDTQSNSYGATKVSVSGTSNTLLNAWVFGPVTAGANTVTVTATGGATDNVAIMVAEITGVSGFDVGHGQSQATPGTGTNLISSGAGTTTATDFIFGISTGQASTSSPAAGTSPIAFTSSSGTNIAVTGFSGLGLGATPCRIEWAASQAAGSIAATFTDATNGATAGYDTIMLAFTEGSATPVFLTAASTITTSGFTAATWNTVSLSGVVPAGAKGAILNLSSTATGAILGLGLRPTGSTDVWQQATNAGTNNSSQQYRHVGLNGSLQFDCYPTAGTNFANSTVEVVGYYGAEAVFLTAAIQLTTAGTSSYNTYNAVTAGVPSGAVGVILGFNERVSQTFGVRQNGSSDDFSTQGGGSNNNGEVICGLDGSGNFQLRTNVGGLTPYIVGYFPSGSNFQWNTNALGVTPNTAGSAQPLNPEAGALGYIYQVANGVVYTIAASGTTGLPAQGNTAGSMGQALCGASPTANLPTLTSATIWELGFFGPRPIRNNTTVYWRPATQFVDESVIQN